MKSSDCASHRSLTRFQSTGALYQFAFNEKDGSKSSHEKSVRNANSSPVLVIAKQYSPSHQAQYRRPPISADQFPDLRSSSDIAWLAWKPLHDKGVKLNHIATWSVTNGATARLIAAALDALADETKTTLDTDLKPYPWKEFDTGKVSGQLVLGEWFLSLKMVMKASRPQDVGEVERVVLSAIQVLQTVSVLGICLVSRSKKVRVGVADIICSPTQT